MSLRRVSPLTTIVVRDAETEDYTLAGEPGKAAGLVQCVVKGEVATREAVKEHVAKLLGKSKPATAPSAPTVPAPASVQTPAPVAKADPAAAPETASVVAPTTEPKPAGVGVPALDSAQAAYRALTGAHDTAAAVKAFGALLGQYPKLIGPMVAGLVDWAASERSQGATMVYSAFVLAVKQGAGKLTEAGMRIGG